MSVRIRLFGTPELEAGGASHALAFERRGQMLAFLACRRSWVGRAELAGLLWPEQADKLAFANLRKTLFRLQAPPWHGLVEVEGQAVRVVQPTDLDAFETALREGRHADALSLRRGELLAGFEDDGNDRWSSWLGFERDRLRSAWRGAALARLDADIDAGEAIDLAARLLEADPFDEAALRAQLRALVESGQAARARQAYDEFVARLSSELGLEPSAELEALHASLADPVERRRSVPPAPSVSVDAGFVGRSVELRRIAALLADDGCRLLTLLGPGGVGKTRLAGRALVEMAPRYADGAVFVALEDAADEDDVGPILAGALGVVLAGRDALEQVVAWLRGRRSLIVLDNVEQLAGRLGWLDRLLRECPTLAVLATSRVRLGVAGEWLLPVEGLPCPDPEDEDRVDAFDAARLFLQTARRVAPGLDAQRDAAAIVEICRLTGGLPLAIELAAAWTRVVSCRDIVASLSDGGEVLRSADPSRPLRHASMEAVFDQSWRMLGAVERDALTRLSVFRGGCSTEAARAVAAAPLPVLAALADKSLLRRDEARLHLHPLVQQLAAAHLDADAQRDAADAHAGYFLRLLAQTRRAVENADGDALRTIDTEIENCRAAWQRAIARDDAQGLAGAAAALVHWCDHRNRFELGVGLLEHALEAPSVAADPAVEGQLRALHAHFVYRLDRYADAEASAERALAAARQAGHAGALARSLQVLGTAALRRGRLDDAERYLAEARRHALDDADPRKAAALLHNLGIVLRTQGRVEDASRTLLEAIAAMRSLGDRVGEALGLLSLGLLLGDRGDPAGAEAQLRASLALCERHGLLGTKAMVLANLTDLAIEVGDDASASAWCEAALAMVETQRNRYLLGYLRLQAARIAVRRRAFADARAALAASLATGVELGRHGLVAEGLRCFAALVGAEGDAVLGRRIARFVAGHERTEAALRRRMLDDLAEAPDDPPWSGPGLDELVQRVVAEGDAAHAPLLAALRSR